MKKTHKPSNSNSAPKPTNGTVSSLSTPPSSRHRSSTKHRPLHSNGSLSQPQLVDLARCNHQRFWTSVTRKLKRYLTCFNPTEPRPKAEENRKMTMDSCNLSEKTSSNGKSLKNCNYYSGMNAEERDEKLKSAIIYCKNSTCQAREISEHENQKHEPFG